MSSLRQRWSQRLSGILLLLAFVPVLVVAWQARSREKAARVDAVRVELARVAEAMDAAIRDRSPFRAGEISALFEQARQASGGRIAWIQLRHGGGSVIARAGLAAAPTFRPEAVRAQLRSGRALYRTVRTPAGPVVVESFAFELPVAIIPIAAGGESGAGVIEIGAFLDYPRAVTAPSRPAPASSEPQRLTLLRRQPLTAMSPRA